LIRYDQDASSACACCLVQKEESSLIGRDLFNFLLFQSRETVDACLSHRERAHASSPCPLQPAALAFVSYGFVLVRVRVRENSSPQLDALVLQKWQQHQKTLLLQRSKYWRTDATSDRLIFGLSLHMLRQCIHRDGSLTIPKNENRRWEILRKLENSGEKRGRERF
jgi:hypothetical protein